MDIIQPIGGDRDLDPVQRVQRAKDERERQERERKKRAGQSPQTADGPQEDVPQGPVEGDDGHLHIDIRA